MKSVYLDNNTAAKPSEAVFKGMVPFLKDKFASPHAPYSLGQDQLKNMEEAYLSLYELIGAKDEATCFFASSLKAATQNVIFSTYFDVTKKNGKNHFITSIVDEAPAIMSMSRLEALGAVLKLCEVDECGCMSPALFKEAITPRTVLLSLSWANGLTGVIQPIQEIAAICRERGILLHLDATHVLGKIFIDLEEIRPDFITFSSDQLHGPKGAACLYVKKGLQFESACPVNVAALVGFGIAAKEAAHHIDLMCTEIARLRDRFEQQILKALPESIVLFQNCERLPNISCIAFPYVFNEPLLFHLNKKGVFATFGGDNFQKISLILEACGQKPSVANTALSFSLSRDTTEEEIDRAVEAIAVSVKDLLKLTEHLRK